MGGSAGASGGARRRYNRQKSRGRTVGDIRDAKRTRQRILDAAAHQFTRKGFDGTTMLGIAQRARVSKQLATHHFGTKEKLFEQVLDLTQVAELARVRQALYQLAEQLETEAPLERVREASEALSKETAEFAARRMNASIQRALSGQLIDSLS